MYTIHIKLYICVFDIFTLMKINFLVNFGENTDLTQLFFQKALNWSIYRIVKISRYYALVVKTFLTPPKKNNKLD